jgi:drug/metabolite transporter (DMT)-like permease
MFEKFKVDTFQAIVVNYITAFTLGVTFFGADLNEQVLTNHAWIFFVVLCSFLFIGLFWLMAKSSQVNGVGTTSIAVKMSLAFSFILMISIFGEELRLLNALGILFGFLSIYLISGKSNSSKNAKNSMLILIVLFIGSGILDFTLGYVQKDILDDLSPALFSAFSFGSAGILGIAILIARSFKSGKRISIRNISAGIILGVPNYFSIYLLMESYRTTSFSDSTVLAITNVGVVLLTSIIGFIMFKEKANLRRLLGLVSAILSIALLALNSM